MKKFYLEAICLILFAHVLLWTGHFLLRVAYAYFALLLFLNDFLPQIYQRLLRLILIPKVESKDSGVTLHLGAPGKQYERAPFHSHI